MRVTFAKPIGKHVHMPNHLKSSFLMGEISLEILEDIFPWKTKVIAREIEPLTS